MRKTIEPIKCASCGCKLVTAMDVIHEQEIKCIFDIRRAKRQFYIEDYEITSDCQDDNEKMLMQVCRTCFDRMISESETLRKLFQMPDGSIIY